MSLVSAESYRQGAFNKPRLIGFGAVYGMEVIQDSGHGLKIAISADVLVRVEILSVQFHPISWRTQCWVELKFQFC